MNFLNMVMLGGLAAGAIPLIIHLFHKSRFKVVHWGAMHLLTAVLRTNQRRLKIEQWILLALRCAIPVLLALMMARPMWQGAAGLLGERATSTVVLLDNSYSMEAGRAGTTNFSLARDETQRLVGDLKRGSAAWVFLMGEGAGLLDEPTRDLTRVTRALDKVGSGYGVAQVPASLRQVAGTLDKMTEGARQVVMLTDFQRVSFPATEDQALGQALARLQHLPTPPTITLWNVGIDARENVAVESLDFSKLMVGVGQKVQFRANLRNFGDHARPDLRVMMKVDGREQATSQVSLGAKAQGQVLFSHVFDRPGSHVVEIATEADAVRADNSYLASIPVRDRLAVLLVDGAPGATPDDLQGETGFARIALSPFAAGKVEQADLIETKVVAAADLTSAGISAAAVVVLANVANLAAAPLQALEGFVEQGGGLLVFTGEHSDPAWWNGAFGKLAPLPLGTRAGTLNEGAPTMGVVSQRFDHPALEMFNDPRNGSLSDLALKAWFRLQPPERTGNPADPLVMARLDCGDPFLAEKPLGQGRVIACATALDSDWSNLPARPSYLPLLQRLCVSLASNVYPPRNLRVGEPLVGFLPAATAGTKALLTLPDTSTVEVPVVNQGTRGVVEYPQTRRPGLYTLLPAAGEAPVHFVVNADRAESDPERLTDAEIHALAKAHGLQLVGSAAEFKALDKVQRYGRELWQWALLVLLGLLFGELLLQQKFACGGAKA
ncbi:MAG: BatA domain-containing protein [Verrucomicrobia bacterium]|nr:BatA domain-containing protein [Verrucomicrobiota bacterium]